MHKLKDTGAVASLGAAKIYDMNVLAKDIQVCNVMLRHSELLVISNNYAAIVQDDSDNITRFLILAREPIISGTHRPFKVIAQI